MRNIFIFFSFTGMLALFACKKNELNVAKFQLVDDTRAYLKVNYASPYALNPGVQLKVNGVRVSNLIIYNTPYPGGGLNTQGSNFGDYLSFEPGKNTLSLSIPKAGTEIDSVSLYSTELALESGAFQTLHVTDTTASTTSVMVQDLKNRPDSGISKFKFVNLMPGTKVDLLFGTTVLKSAVDYKQVTDTFYIATGTIQQFRVRLNGMTANLATYPTTATTYTIPNSRVMTIYLRGYNIVSTTDIRRPQLSLLFNK